MENRERGIGWPLGLGSMYMRLTMVDDDDIAAADTRSSLCFHSSSFSSFSSSNLDTESSASFFQDKSKSLGRLIGVRQPRHRRSELCASNSALHCSETPHMLRTRTSTEHSNESDMELCDGICIPLCLVAKASKNKNGSNR